MHPCLDGVMHCNWMFSIYGALACGAALMAWNAAAQRDDHRARAHGFSVFVNMLEALLHLRPFV